MAVQMDIGRVWDLKYHYCLDLTNTVPIRVKPPRLCPEEEAWLDVHLDEWWPRALLARFCQGSSRAVLCHCS